jgi:predicted amidohydrolase
LSIKNTLPKISWVWDMKISVFQFAPEFGEKEKNLRKIEANIQSTNADLIVLPELCTTGYQFISRSEVDNLCEPVPDGPTVRRWIRMCREKGLFLVGGLGEIENGIPYNTAVLVGPDGYIGSYRKIHRFCEEKEWFQPGNLGFPVWDVGSAKIGIMICFDWVFPEAARSLALQSADILCHPVNLVLPYCQDAMVTRAIENGVFTVTANRIGSEARGGREKLTFTGRSQAVSPKGKVLFRLEEDTEALQTFEIDPMEARDKNITRQNHLFDDRISDQYIFLM